MVGGAGAVAADDSGVLDAGLARTGMPVALLVAIGLALLVGGFLLLRVKLQAAEESA